MASNGEDQGEAAGGEEDKGASVLSGIDVTV